MRFFIENLEVYYINSKGSFQYWISNGYIGKMIRNSVKFNAIAIYSTVIVNSRIGALS